MRIRLQPWQLAVCVVALSCAAVGVARWRKNAVTWGAARMIAALPSEHATLLYLNVDALRRSGVLERLVGPKTTEEADYRRFVEQIGFDYRTDLDSVAAAFLNGDSYFVVHGRFQWTQLAEYARTQGGACHYAVCSLPASTVGHKISFYPLSQDVLALAATSDRSSVDVIAPSSVTRVAPLPPEPVWIEIPSSALVKSASLPPGVQTFLGSVTRADRVTIAVGADGQHPMVRLSVACKTLNDAEMVRMELYDATNALRNVAVSESPAPGQPDWVGFLRSGTFVRNESEVTGTWPMEQGFLAALVSSEAP